MRNSSIYRSNLSGEKVAFLSELKNQKEYTNEDDTTPKTYKRQGKQKELDLLWQNFKVNTKEEKSPGVYLLTGFIAGALCMFIMNSILSISSNISAEPSATSFGQPKFEKKISRKSKIPQINNQDEIAELTDVSIIPASTQVAEESMAPALETYTVKRGDSLSSIVIRFYGKYDSAKIEKIRKANNLSSTNKLSIGQKLVIPLD